MGNRSTTPKAPPPPNTTRIPLKSVTNTLAFLLMLGGGLILLSGYEWPMVRSVDLYSWCPAAKSTYRYFWGQALTVFLPDSFIEQGMPLANLVGVHVQDEAVAERLVQQLRDPSLLQSSSFVDLDTSLYQELLDKFQSYSSRQSLNSNSTLSDIQWDTKKLVIVYYVDDTPVSWYDYFWKTNLPGLHVRVFEHWGHVRALIPETLVTRWTLTDLSYTKSPLYWALMCLPVLFLVFDVRLFPSQTLSSRQALFRPLHPLLLWGKRYLLDPLMLLFCFLMAHQVQLRGFEHWTTAQAIGVGTLDWLFYIASRQAWRGAAILRSLSLLIRFASMIVLNAAVYRYETQQNIRISSTFAVLATQLLSVAILSEVFCWAWGKHASSPDPSKQRGENQLITPNDMESGLVKYVFSMHFYTAAATKLGAAGLGWIDPRYIAQLALRGRYQDIGAYPLESALLWVPPFYRAVGMAAALIMELSAVCSWWKFDWHAYLWLVFMIFSTLSIGVPIRAFALGPLQTVLFGSLAEVWAHFRVVLVLLLVLGMSCYRWNPRGSTEKFSSQEEKED